MLISLLCLSFAIVGMVGAYRGVRAYQCQRLATRARDYIAAGDLKSASLSCRSILQIDRHNVDALRLLGQIAEETGARVALEYRGRAASGAPNSPNDQMALARTALQFDEIAVAQSAMKRIQSRDRNVAAYHEILARIAVAKKDPARAREEYAEAVKLEPSNKNNHLNLAVFDLQSHDPEVRLGASKFLQGLLDDEKFRAPAAHALMDAALQRRDPAIVEIARLQFKFAETSFRDRLRCLEVFRQLQLPRLRVGADPDGGRGLN